MNDPACLHSPAPTRLAMALVLVLAATPGRAAEKTAPAAMSPHPTIPAFARFFDNDKADTIRGGRLLMTELNCTSCHTETARPTSVKTRQAPLLDQIGSRVQPEWMIRFLANPHQTKPGTTMPDLFPGLDPKSESAQVEALVNFLASTGSVRATVPQPAEVVRGNRLFHAIGCVACHQSRQDPKAATLPTSVPLGQVQDKYTLASLAGFLKNPLAVRPGGRMPSLNLNDREARDLAGYFFQDFQLPPNLAFAYYEGRWSEIPDFSKLKPRSTGKTSGFQLGIAGRKDYFGLRFTGFLQVPRDGRYTFFLGSDDGSRLQIDGKTVVEVNGIHAYVERNKSVELSAGPHPLLVDFFEANGGEVLKVEFQGPGISRRPLSNNATPVAKPKPPKPKPGRKALVLDPSQIEQGRVLFTKLGCAACHQAKHKGQPLRHTGPPAPALAKLDSRQGCLSAGLAASPAKNVPDFRLSQRQRKSLVATLAAPRTSPTAKSRITETIQTFNCLACHAREKLGGVERTRNPLFVTTIKEMGDEGRIPPLLDGVGDKLNDNWLKQVLDNGANDRPYMLTRMPRFGTANVGHLVADLASVDRKQKPVALTLEERVHRVRSAGRFLSGGKALACIKCHYFGGHKATGIQSLDLLTMTRRLRKDWFIRYMLDPQAYRPGTRMPAAWPRGQTLLPDVLDGVPKHQIAGIWEYLVDGGKAGLPSGLIRNPIELVPGKEPIIYRNFITGVSPRGIAVGYPEKANLTFDADQLALRLIWHNAFIDASRHWNGRGQGFQPPLGDHLVTLPGGVPFASLESPDAAWPTQPAREQGYRFRGYRIDGNRRPIFRYHFGELTVEDFPKPVPTSGDAELVRTLTLAPRRSGKPAANPIRPNWYRAAVDASILPEKDGSFLVGKILKVTITQNGGETPKLRRQGKTSELLVPIHWNGDRAVIVQKYSW